jgi:F-type H+-transporting ATPase subunit b
MEALAKLGIDINSILIYLINFGILFAVVAYFITGPVVRMLEKRRKEIEGNLNKAETIKREFVDERKKLEKERDAVRVEMETQLSHMKKELESKRKQQEEAMDLKKAKMMEDMRSVMEEEKGKIMENAEKQTLDLISKVLMHIVSNKIPQEVIQESVRDAWKTYQK